MPTTPNLSFRPESWSRSQMELVMQGSHVCQSEEELTLAGKSRELEDRKLQEICLQLLDFRRGGQTQAVESWYDWSRARMIWSVRGISESHWNPPECEEQREFWKRRRRADHLRRRYRMLKQRWCLEEDRAQRWGETLVTALFWMWMELKLKWWWKANVDYQILMIAEGDNAWRKDVMPKSRYLYLVSGPDQWQIGRVKHDLDSRLAMAQSSMCRLSDMVFM